MDIKSGSFIEHLYNKYGEEHNIEDYLRAYDFLKNGKKIIEKAKEEHYEGYNPKEMYNLSEKIDYYENKISTLEEGWKGNDPEKEIDEMREFLKNKDKYNNKKINKKIDQEMLKMTDEQFEIARQRMESYVLFSENKGVGREYRIFYRGAAAAINDLICKFGRGDEVTYLIDRLSENALDLERGYERFEEEF